METPLWRAAVRLLALYLAAAALTFGNTRAADAETTKTIELKGRVLPIPNSTNLQFRVETNTPISYKLLPSRDAKALFADTNLHSRILLVKGRLDKNSALEIIGNLHTLKNGELYELYYYCDICSIETSFPGPCLCCREDVVLLERPKK